MVIQAHPEVSRAPARDEAGAPADRVKTTPREAPPLHLCRRERALLDALGRSVDLHRPLVLVAVVPLVGWTLVLALHLWHVYGRGRR